MQENLIKLHSIILDGDLTEAAKLCDELIAVHQPPACNQSMQPLPELATKVAPVQLPEPFAYVEHHKAGDNLWFDCPGGKYSGLYTEYQVRQLLAAARSLEAASTTKHNGESDGK